MKRVLLVALVLVAACQKAPQSTPPTDGYDEQTIKMIAASDHMSPTEVRQRLADAQRRAAEDADNPVEQERIRELHREQAADAKALHDIKCQQYTPYSDDCN